MSGRQSNALAYALAAIGTAVASAAIGGPFGKYLWFMSLVAAGFCGWTMGGRK